MDEQKEQEPQQTQEEILTIYGKLQPFYWQTPIHCELGEKMDALIIEWTRDNYNLLIVNLDWYQAEYYPNNLENGLVTPYDPSIYLRDFLPSAMQEAGFYKPGSSLNTHILNSNIVKEYIEHVDTYVSERCVIEIVPVINVHINSEEEVVEAFLYHYLLQRHVMLNEFIEIRDNPIIMK